LGEEQHFSEKREVNMGERGNEEYQDLGKKVVRGHSEDNLVGKV